ncbi:MAG: hypothetical protein V4709_10750 [Pseudomonadota bacterium]
MSLEGLAALLLLAAALVGLALWRGRKAARQIKTLETDLHRAEIAGREQAARIAALEALRDSSQLAEHAIATGTAVVKEVHKGIADIPFSVLEAIPATAKSAKLLRGLHDSISDGVYGALGNLNKAVGRELRKSVPLADAPPQVISEPIEIPAAHPDKAASSERDDEDAAPPPTIPPKSWG